MLIPSLNINIHEHTPVCCRVVKILLASPIRKASSPRRLLLLSVSSQHLNPVHSFSNHLVALKSLFPAAFL